MTAVLRTIGKRSLKVVNNVSTWKLCGTSRSLPARDLNGSPHLRNHLQRSFASVCVVSQPIESIGAPGRTRCRSPRATREAANWRTTVARVATGFAPGRTRTCAPRL